MLPKLSVQYILSYYAYFFIYGSSRLFKMFLIDMVLVKQFIETIHCNMPCSHDSYIGLSCGYLGFFNQPIGLVGWMFANGLGGRGSNPDQIIPKTQKQVLDTILLNTRYYKVYINGKVKQSRERSSTFSYTSV